MVVAPVAPACGDGGCGDGGCGDGGCGGVGVVVAAVLSWWSFFVAAVDTVATVLVRYCFFLVMALLLLLFSLMALTYL